MSNANRAIRLIFDGVQASTGEVRVVLSKARDGEFALVYEGWFDCCAEAADVFERMYDTIDLLIDMFVEDVSRPDFPNELPGGCCYEMVSVQWEWEGADEAD